MNRRWLYRGMFLLPLLVAVACDWFEDPSPEIVRVMIDSDAETLLVVTSTQFLTTADELGDLGVRMFSADTAVVTSAFDQSWNIEEEKRFVLVAFPADSATATVRLRVMLDGDTDLDNTIGATADDPVQYIYIFNQQVVPDFDLL